MKRTPLFLITLLMAIVITTQTITAFASEFPTNLSKNVLLCEGGNIEEIGSYQLFKMNAEGELTRVYVYIQSQERYERVRGKIYSYEHKIESYEVKDGIVWFKEIYQPGIYRGTKGKKGFKLVGFSQDKKEFYYQEIKKGGWFSDDEITIHKNPGYKCTLISKAHIREQEQVRLKFMRRNFCDSLLRTSTGKIAVPAFGCE